MRRLIDFSYKFFGQQLFVVITLLAASSLVWGEGAVTTVEEPREVPGFIIVAIIFNLTLATVIFVLLRKEWNKRKMASKPTSNSKCEGK